MNEGELMDIRVAEMKRQNEIERLQEEALRRRRAQRSLTPSNDDGKPKKVLGVLKDGKFEDWIGAADIFGFKA